MGSTGVPSSERRPLRLLALAGLLLLLLGSFRILASDRSPEGEAAGREERLRAMREQIVRLRSEVETIRGQEKGILGELRRLEAGRKLREAEWKEASARLEAVSLAIADRTRRLGDLEVIQRDRHRYLTFRLREMYKRGPEAPLRRFLEGREAEEYLHGLRYAAYLSEKDSKTLEAYRRDVLRLDGEREDLVREKGRLAAVRSEAERARAALAETRAERARHLAGVRRDRGKREEALRELEAASKELGGLVKRIGAEGSAPEADPVRARGELDWPAEGKVVAGFGPAIHPQFRTAVPHPGLDIEAPEGSDIRAVLDGTVAYSSWLRGYGLTAIVDHGGGVVSIYAHAAVLLVEAGEKVRRGQTLGKVGDTGSLRGAYLYFEIRQDGRPVDPMSWLRRR